MKNFFYINLVLFAFCHTTFAAEKESQEKYRAGNVYEKINVSAFPQLQSIQDCYQLGLSLMQSEIKFWKDTQLSLLEENQRLRIIVKLLAPPSLEQKSQPSLSDFKGKLANLDLRLKILINPNDPSDTTNKDLFDMYTSYSTIIKDLESILRVYESHKVSGNPSTFQEQEKFLREIKKTILAKSKDIEKANFLNRGLIQNNTRGMGISQICYSQKGQFQSTLPDMFGKYAFCDVEYVTQLFIPTIAQLFDTTQETLQQLYRTPEAERAFKTKGRGKKKKRVPQVGSLSQQLNTPVAQVVDLEPLLITHTQPDVPFSKTQKTAEKKTSNAPLQEEAEGADLSISPFNPTIEQELEPKPAGIVSEILPTQEAGSDALYNMRPWEAFQKKELLEKKYLKPEPLKALDSSTIFKLDEEYAATARILLGLGNASQEKVTMSGYQQLITKGLGGAVFDRKKCVHFMARSILTRQWCSVAMHRLHQDDPHIIPHSTRYWKIARQLLLDAGLDESNL